MGFRATRKLYKLVFEEDSDIFGLEIVAKGTTLGERRSYMDKFPNDAAPLDKFDYEIDFFVEHVTDWNLEDEDGNALPISRESLSTSLDTLWIRQIVSLWMTRSNGSLAVEPDLKKESSGGSATATTPDLEELLPMEPLP
jgi:hypothetical protein